QIRGPRERNERFGLVMDEREGLLDVDVRPAAEAEARQLEVARRRGRDVDDVGPRLAQQRVEADETGADRETLADLPNHQRLDVARRDDLASGRAKDLRGMRV